MFIESSNQGGSWSKPLKLGVLSGYRPAESDIIVDKAGLPHVFYGVFKEGGPSIINHRMRRPDGSWTADENILGDKQTRPIWTQAELDPVSGDIYVSWLEVQSGVSRWDAATGKWSYSENISNSSPRASFPTIAVNTQTGTVWDIWSDEDNIWSRQSSDHAQTWQPRELVVNLGAAKVGRMFGLKARSTRGIIYLLISADQLDPLYYVGPTLSLMTFDQSVTQPPVSTVTAGATSTPGGTSTPIVPVSVSPAPITVSPTATPANTRVAPTITPQPTATPQPTVTQVPTVTPQPTATPQTLPTGVPPTVNPVPTATATIQPTSTPLPTATARPLPPTATTSQPIPAQVPPKAQATEPAVPVTPSAPIVAANTASIPSPGGTATLAPEAVQATAMAEAQRQAAASPQTLVVPLAPVGSGGRGPALVLPTATPSPTSIPEPTSTPLPTFTPEPSTPAATVDSEATASAQATESAVAQNTSVRSEPSLPTVPPPTGALWLLPVGLVVAVKGLLNVLALLLKP